MNDRNFEQLALPPAPFETTAAATLGEVDSPNDEPRVEIRYDEEKAVFGKDLNSSDVLLGETSDKPLLDSIADGFSLGEIVKTSNPYHHTTTSRKLIIETSKGSFFIKKKAAYCSEESRVQFACAFQNSMSEVMPNIPLLLDGNGTSGYLAIGNSVYIASPVIEGKPFMGLESQVRGAARALSELHNHSMIYTEKVDAQLEEKDSKADAIEFISMAGDLEGSEGAPKRDEVIGQLITFVEEYSSKQTGKQNLQKIITHGDFTASNLLFDESGNTVGINDFDNCGFNLRIRDVAESMMTFCDGVNYMGATSSLRHPISSGVNLNRATKFLTVYSEGLTKPLSENELDGIANEMALAWCELMALGIVRGDFNYKHVHDSSYRFIDSVEELRAEIMGA